MMLGTLITDGIRIDGIMTDFMLSKYPWPRVL
jgi:hypothetical protein